MTTLRKLPTIAPAAKAKTLSRLNIESYAIPATRANVTTRALRNGGEWGLVASAVFKTVVSARKRRRVGSIPTRLRQRARSASATACDNRRMRKSILFLAIVLTAVCAYAGAPLKGVDVKLGKSPGG